MSKDVFFFSPLLWEEVPNGVGREEVEGRKKKWRLNL